MTRPKSSPPRAGRLFVEPHPAPPPASVHTAHVDGASRGNPGPASYAVIIRAPNGKPVFEFGKYLGRATNNVAEYYALITALDYAVGHDIRNLRVRSDSQLLVNQMRGTYKVKSADLRPLHERALKLASSFDYFAIEYVPREHNRDADRLANDALDRTDDGGAAAPASAERLSWRPDRDSLLPGAPPLRSRTIRARYVKGALMPAEPIDLPEGAEVEIRVVTVKRS
jgi:ribonuclease HI